ncbi:MAG TPA: hypothetical protein GX692_09030 [Acholeplasmataceae bacterium]|nr:hypothetical protein [Acholeplasmataceae bacterium]
MAIYIHFFRDSGLEKLDFLKVFEFFESYPNFKIFYTDEEVQIDYRDDDFKFAYRYLITKKSRVSQIYKLNPQYLNVNFLLELPVLVPSFLVKEILALTQKLCKLFDLEIYNDVFQDVQPFNLADVVVLFENMRREAIAQYGMQDKLSFEKDKLDEVCRYQRSVASLREYYHNEVEVNLVEPIIDKITNEYGISVVWNAGVPTVFPPHLSYIYVKEEQNIPFLVRRKDFMSIMGKYLIEIVNFLPDMYILKPKQAKASRKVLNKLRKVAIIDQNFKSVRLANLIDI